MKFFQTSSRGVLVAAVSVLLLSGPGRLGNQVAASTRQADQASDTARIEWVTVTGGAYAMGGHQQISDAGPIHQVSIRTFQMARTLVTNRQYRACVEAGACTPIAIQSGKHRDDQPVVNVTWNQAAAFSRWVGGRLPSESEWEFAARSRGKNREYPWGNEPATCERAVINDGKWGCGHLEPWPVCSKLKGATDQGLCDMSGNANQWVQDLYHDSYAGAPADGAAWENSADPRRVLRGGAWCSTARGAAATTRIAREPQDTYQGAGFRPARF